MKPTFIKLTDATDGIQCYLNAASFNVVGTRETGSQIINSLGRILNVTETPEQIIDLINGSDPADGAIDVAWLKSLGFIDSGTPGDGFHLVHPTLDFEISIGYRWQWIIDTQEIPRQPQTRGDVLRLLDVLGMK